MKLMRFIAYCLVACTAAVLFYAPAFAHDEEPHINEYLRARVISIEKEGVTDVAGLESPYQIVRVEMLSGTEKGKNRTIEYGTDFSLDEAQKVRVGDRIIINKTVTDEETQYFIMGTDRSNALLFISALFFIAAVLLGKLKGFTSILGMVFSIFILITFVIPSITAGSNPLVVSLIATFTIAFISLYLAHGFNKKTHIALISTLITLVLATGLSTLFVWMAKLNGFGSEETQYLQWGGFAGLDFRGLLLGGIIIGALGVLDDITTAQTAVVYELKRANPALHMKELYHRGLAVGREHIASLVNTLVLAYAGVSLPSLILFTKDSEIPFWVALNSEFIAEEIVRALVGSLVLVCAVPIATFLAARVFGKKL